MKRALRRISIFDTTMRDGEAAPGNSMSVATKVTLGQRIEALGVDVIEPGFPAASDVDQETVRRLSTLLVDARLNLFCRATTNDIDVAFAALRGPVDFQVQILAVGSDIHLRHKRRIGRDQAIQEASDAVAYTRRKGCDQISVALEDATRGEHDYLRSITEACVEAGATMICIPDTTGASLPHEYADLVVALRSWVGPDVGISAHCHDDMGLAVANALAAVEAGADEVQATLVGIGERSGNTALEELVAALIYKQSHYGVTTGVREELLYPVAMELAEAIHLPLSRQKSVIGENAFATEAGIHQAGLLNNPVTYEFLEPARFGRDRRILIGRQSGRRVIRHRLAEAGMAPSDDLVEQMYARIIGSSNPAAFNERGLLLSTYNELAKVPVG